MPKIGMCIIKSSFAVFLCFLISLLRSSQGIPFYSAIAAILCLQRDLPNSKKVALNRILDTLIGIFVSLGVNAFHFPRRKNTHFLYVIDMNPIGCEAEKEITSYSKNKINLIIEQGAMITFAFSSPPSHFLLIINGIHCSLPVISMNGAALYDIKNQSYSSCKTLESLSYQQILSTIQKQGLNCFITCIIYDMLHTFYGDFTNQAEQDFYYSQRKNYLENFVYSTPPKASSPLTIMVLDTGIHIDNLYDQLMRVLTVPLNIIRENDAYVLGYSSLKIYSSEVSKKNAIEELQTLLPISAICCYDVKYPETDPIIKSITQHFYSKI